MTDTAAALAYLREQFGEGWQLVYRTFARDHEWEAARAGVSVRGSGHDPMSAARACVEVWREASKSHRDVMLVWDRGHPEGHILKAELDAERAHADRLAERVRNLEKLAACYRMRRSPSEKLLDDLRDSNGWEAAHDALRSGGRS